MAWDSKNQFIFKISDGNELEENLEILSNLVIQYESRNG